MGTSANPFADTYSNRVFLGANASSIGFLEVRHNTRSGTATIRSDAVSGASLPDLAFAIGTGGAVVPSNHDDTSLGWTTRFWLNNYSMDFHAGKTDAKRVQGQVLFANTDVTSTTTAVLAGIVKNAATAAEVAAIQLDNLHVSNSLFVKTGSGDISCTNIDDGYFAQATTPNELQTCEGAAMFLTPYIAASFAPVTLNCTAGQSLEDPRFENGILVEGSCVTR